MAIITEQNCPTLRFLKWDKPLLQHPLFLKWKRDGKNDTRIPYLDFKFPSRLIAMTCKQTVEHWDDISRPFLRDIWTTSIAFGKAFEAASDSICKHRVELYNEMVGPMYMGTAIHATEDIPICFLYSLRLFGAKKEMGEGGQEGIHVQWEGMILMVSGSELIAAAVCDNDAKRVISDASPKLKQIFTETNGSVDSGLLFSVMDQLVFRKYANVTIRNARETSRKGKGAHDKDEELIVKTTIPEEVHRYDVNWFTETIRTAGFARKGYLGFRWKGPRGNQQRVLVPIKATWVKGYTRKAKKPYSETTLKDFDHQVE